MKLGLGTSFILALAFHGALLGVLAVNVSLERPHRPEDRPGKIIQATVVNMPPAKGSPAGAAKTDKDKAHAVDTSAQAAAQAEAERLKKQAELAKQVEAQKAAEEARKKAIALKKKAEEEAKKKAEEEAKKKAEAEAKKKAEEEAKKKAEAEAKKKAEEEARKKAEAEAKKKAEEEARKLEEQAKAAAEAEAKKKAEEEAKRLEEQAKAAADAEAQRLADMQADALEQELLGKADGVDGGVGLGSGDGSDDRLAYGNKVRELIEQNWRIDPSMNNKRVVVTVTVDDGGLIVSEKCDGDRAVCASAIATIRLIGILPRPPQQCVDCSTIIITMTPKIG